MRRVYLYEDLECTVSLGQFVSQDWNPEEELTTAHNDNNGVYIDATKQSIITVDDPIYSEGAIGVEEGENTATSGPQVTSIADSTIVFPLGEVEELSGQQQPTTHEVYIEGGIKLEYQYYHFNETHITGIYIAPPQYFTGYDEQQRPVFTQVFILGNGGGYRYWLGTPNKDSNDATPITFDSDTYTNPRVVFFEAPVKFRKTTSQPEPAFSVTEQAFIPILVADNNGAIETLNGKPHGYPSALTINCLNSEEVIPPAPDESGESSGIHRDGTGTGIGISDPADTIDVDALNRGALNWNGHGYGLTYYSIDLISFTRDVVGTVYGAIFKNSLDAWSEAIDSVINPTADSMAINAQTIRNCIVSAYLLPNIPTQDTRVDKIWVGPLPIDQSNALTYYVGDRYQTLYDAWITDVEGHENFSDEGFGDFNDFTNTTATLHLPFVGDIPIDVCSFNRGNIRVKTVLDQFTGNISYEVHTLSMEANGGVEVLYGIYSGNCAVEQPICALGTSANVLSRIINAGSQAVGAAINVASGNFVQAGMGAFSAITAADTAVASREVVNRGGILDKNTGPLQTDAVTLQITRPIPLKPYNRVDIEGIPAATKQPIRQFTGFLKVKSCDLKGLSCEEPEKEKILALLKEGVYI